jgi:hypothetical protein
MEYWNAGKWNNGSWINGLMARLGIKSEKYPFIETAFQHSIFPLFQLHRFFINHSKFLCSSSLEKPKRTISVSIELLWPS